MILLAVLAGITALVVAYALWLRPWMRVQETGWPKRFMDWIEPLELWGWKKSETTLVNLWVKFASLLVVGLDVFGWVVNILAGIDPTMVLPLVPPEHASKVAVAFYILGYINQKLRDRTTKPVELAAVPNDAPLEVHIAVAQAASSTANAVAVVKAAKAADPIPKT